MSSYLRSIYNSLPDSLVSNKEEAKYVAANSEDEECYNTWGITLSEEEVLVQQLRSEVELTTALAPRHNDHMLRRFLRARKHNIAAAREMLLATLKWRESFKADTIQTDFEFHEKPEFAKYYPEGYYGVDRVGRPIYIQQPGNIDLDNLFKFTTEERCLRYHVQQQERYISVISPACTVASGRCADRSLVLIDLEGVGVSTLTSDFRALVGLVLSIDQDHYPELMWKSVIINAPTTFRVLWGMVKYMLDARTQAKVQVLGSNWKAELQEFVPPDQLMERYGGTNPAPLSASPGPWQNLEILKKVAAMHETAAV